MKRNAHVQPSLAWIAFLIASALPAARAALAVPPDYRVEDGRLSVSGESPDCPMIYDNDWWQDVPDAAYLWAKASLGECDLRANIITRSEDYDGRGISVPRGATDIGAIENEFF